MIKTPVMKHQMINRRAMLCCALSLVLLIVDGYTPWFGGVRSFLSAVLYPVRVMAQLPSDVTGWSQEALVSRSELQERNARLRQQNLYLQGRLQKYASLLAENGRLRELLGSKEVVDSSVIVGEVIGVDPDPFRSRVIINKGSVNGLVEGMPILDSNGLLGQIVKVGYLTSYVLLIDDALHAVPVRVVRSGARAIAAGLGQSDALSLLHVPKTADIEEGDLLVTSGLGQRFPPGYPVAEVASTNIEDHSAFMEVEARPSARIDSIHRILIVNSVQKTIHPIE